MSNRLFVLVSAILILIFFSCASLAEGDANLALNWSENLDGNVRALALGDFDNDGVKDIAVALEKEVIVYSREGKLVKRIPVGFTPSALRFADIDNDSLEELLAGSGEMRTWNLSVQRFNFSDPENIIHRPAITYMVTRNLGDVYLIEERGAASLFLSIGSWVRDIDVTDFDNDSSPEYVIASGGVNIDYVERTVLEKTKPEVIDHYRIGADEDLCSTLAHRHANTSIQCDYIILPSTDKFRDPVSGIQYDGFMDVNETIPPRLPEIYVYNMSQDRLDNGSILIFAQNKSLVGTYNSSEIIWDMDVSPLTKGSPPFILTGSSNVLVIDMKGNVTAEFSSPEPNYSVRHISTASISNPRTNDVIVGFSRPSANGVYVLDRSGTFLWTYFLASKDINGLVAEDLDSDGVPEVLIVLDKKAYVLNDSGQVIWSHSFPEEASIFEAADFEGKGVFDYVTASGSKLSVYGVDQFFLKRLVADRLLLEAEGLYSTGDYNEALKAVERSRAMYVELKSFDEVEKCDALTEKIASDLGETKKEAASSLYKKGISEYYIARYESAREYIQKARAIYLEVGDKESVLRCDEALKDIDAAISIPTTLVQTTTSLEVTTTTRPASTDYLSILPLMLSVAVGLCLVIVWMRYSQKRRAKKKETDEKKLGEEKPRPLEKM